MASPVDIRPDHLEIVQGILHEHLPVGVKVWVFGSRANWTTKDSSDLDLALEGNGQLSHKLLGALKDAFEDSSLPYTVDLVDMNRIGDSFKRIVESQRTPLPLNGLKHTTTGQWHELPFSEAVQINPAVRLDRGAAYPFVDMAAVASDSRSAISSEEREFKGSGSRFQSGDTLMARITPCLENGKIARYQATGDRQEAHGSTEFIVIRGRSDVTDNDFAYYLTQWEEVRNYAIGQMTGTSGRQRVPVDCLDNLEIPLPPLSEQRAIAHILGTLDDKIDLNRRMTQTLEAMARALFKSWFVDFDPVRAKMEGRWRPGESLPGLPAHLYDLFPDRLVDSELGEIPEGWAVSTIEDIAERVAMGPFGSSIQVATFVDAGIPVISGQHLNGILLEDNHYRFITQDHAQTLAKANVKRGDVIFTHAGSIGQVSYIPQTSQFERYVISQRQFYLRCNTSRVSPRFIVHFFKTPIGQHKLLANTSSTGVPSIARPVTYLRSIKFCLPFEPVWREYDRIVGTTDSIVARNVAESYSLAAQRDVLLTSLISRSVRIEELK